MDYEQKYKAALEWMQGMYGGLHGKTKEEAEKYFPELAENEDERIRKTIIRFFKDQYSNETEMYDGSVTVGKAIAWLEKLGYKQQGKTALEAIMEEKSPVESLGISPEKYEEIVNECIYGKSADKVEPKFKVGDWITGNRINNDTIQINSVDDRFYWHDDNRIGGRIDAMDKAYHLWSIADAKDGDILVNGSNIFIFSHLSDTRAMGYCHINLDDGRFYDDKGKNECFGLIDTVFSPATKEQCDLLFAKMKEAGYEWNAEKKKLRKEPVKEELILSELSLHKLQDILEDLGLIDENGKCDYTAEEMFRAGLEYSIGRTIIEVKQA